jgi:hypothetical protein
MALSLYGEGPRDPVGSPEPRELAALAAGGGARYIIT